MGLIKVGGEYASVGVAAELRHYATGAWVGWHYPPWNFKDGTFAWYGKPEYDSEWWIIPKDKFKAAKSLEEMIELYETQYALARLQGEPQ